jgi:peptidyl-prolyl cis-trans isomerase SurA
MHKITYLNIIVSALVYAVLSTGINAKTLNRIVAVVEEDVITESELQQRVGALVKQYDKNRGALPPQDVLIEQVLQRLIVERLQIQLAERRGIQIDDLSLDQAMRNLAKRNNLSLEDFRNELVKQGHDYAAFRDQVRNEMLLDQLRRRTIDLGVEVTDSEIEDLVKKSDEDLLKKDYEYHLAHILIALPENPQAEQLEKLKYRASSVYDRASAGNNFAQLAIAASDAQDD